MFIRNNRDENAHAEFKRSRSEVKAYNRKAKSKYFRSKCDAHVRNNKQLWNVTHQKHIKIEPACSIDSLADTFARVVTDSSRPFILPIPSHPPSCRSRLTCFQPVLVETVHSLLLGLQVSKATGSDGIPASL